MSYTCAASGFPLCDETYVFLIVQTQRDPAVWAPLTLPIRLTDPPDYNNDFRWKYPTDDRVRLEINIGDTWAEWITRRGRVTPEDGAQHRRGATPSRLKVTSPTEIAKHTHACGRRLLYGDWTLDAPQSDPQGGRCAAGDRLVAIAGVRGDVWEILSGASTVATDVGALSARILERVQQMRADGLTAAVLREALDAYMGVERFLPAPHLGVLASVVHHYGSPAHLHTFRDEDLAVPCAGGQLVHLLLELEAAGDGGVGGLESELTHPGDGRTLTQEILRRAVEFHRVLSQMTHVGRPLFPCDSVGGGWPRQRRGVQLHEIHSRRRV